MTDARTRVLPRGGLQSDQRMILDIGLLILGGVFLYFGAEWLVSGAAALARRLGIAPLVIGLTIVSYGTSAPELAVSVLASLQDRSAIALGNVIGSNIANIGLILGLTALLRPPRVDRLLFRREVPFLLFATCALVPALWNEEVSRVEGALFTLGAGVFTWATFRWAKHRDVPGSNGHDRERPAEVVDAEELDAAARRGVAALWGMVGGGLLVLLAGGQSFVSGATGIAAELGISERVVGLTVVAFGTSLPELAASVVAAYRGHSDIAVGNVVGSNLFNILLILGASATVSPISAVMHEVAYDLTFMTVLTFVMAATMWKERLISRWEGGAFLMAYVGFVATLVIAGAGA